MPSTSALIDATLRGESLALARVITLVERDAPEVPEILRRLAPHTGRAYTIGVTGPPGSGKSTVVDQITAVLRAAEGSPTVGIIAVDPTSPFTGGAILGDRIRMQRHYADPGVFIRSMASRGSHGGLPGVARRVASVLDAASKSYVLAETVGVGQTELDVMDVADTVVVVLVPEGGDTVQAMKAGLMEIADVFVVNKADRDGADRIAAEIRSMLHLGPRRDWEVPVLLTKANRGEGIKDVVDAIHRHRAYLESSGELQRKRRQRRVKDFFRAVEERLSASLQRLLAEDEGLQKSLRRVELGELDPYSAATEALSDPLLIQRLLSPPKV